MKKALVLLTIIVCTLVFAADNLIPNGDFRDANGPKPHIRTIREKNGFTFQQNALILDIPQENGLVEINYHKLPIPETGKRFFVRVPFDVLEPGTGSVHKVSARILFFGSDGKQLPKLNRFPSPVLPAGPGKYDLFFSLKMPEDAVRLSFTFWFAGLKKVRIEKFIFSREFPADSPDGNLILNGSLETPTLASFYFRGLSDSPRRSLERSMDKARTGRWSLRSVCKTAEKGTEINFNLLPFSPGKKYRFNAFYFVASAEGKNRVSGRVMFLDANGKPIRYIFPEFKSSPGEWHKMDVEFFPPSNCARVTLTLWLSGKQTVYLDDFHYGIIEEKESGNRNSAAVQLKDSAQCTIWKDAYYRKIPSSGVPAGMKTGTVVKLSAAANESEPFQIVVSAKKDLPGVALAFSPLEGKNGVIPAKALSVKRVGFINLKNPDNPSLKGLNADPLLPEQTAAAAKDRNLPFFVTVSVPPGTPAGIYEGEVRVLSRNTELGRLRLSLRVFDFELPVDPYLKTFFYLRAFAPYNRWDKRPDREKQENFHRLLRDHRITGNQALVPPSPKWKIENGSLKVTDWTAFDREVEHRSKVYGQRDFIVPLLKMQGDNGGWFTGGKRTDKPGKSPFGKFNLISPEGLKYAGEYAAAFCAHVKEKFPGLSFYAYIYDEPPAKVYADLKKLLDHLHTVAPELKIFTPKQVTDEIGYVHTFCVPLTPGYYHPGLQATHKQHGGDIWYYNWPVSISSHNYIRNRLFSWQIYAGNGSGGLLWMTIDTPMGVNPWTDLDKTFGCGGATIFYPPRKAGEGNIASQRAALIRESIDDFDYFRILEQLIDRHYPGTGRIRVMEILRSVFTGLPFEFVNDPHLLACLREKIAEEIENFKKFPAVVVSSPSANTRTEVSEVKFKVFAPAGTAVKINGKPAGTVAQKALEILYTLEKIGTSSVQIELTCKGRKYTMERIFNRAESPRLKELAALVERAAKAKIDTRSASSFLAGVRQGKSYTEKDRVMTDRLTEKLKYALTVRTLKENRSFVNPLEKFFFSRAREVFGWKLFERAEYYLGLAAEAARAGNMDHFKVRVTPVTFKGHSAFCIDNGIIRAVILETGATLVSFQINGTETLVPGDFHKILPPRERAIRKVTRAMAAELGGYGGFTDAGGDGIWPVSFVDWNLAIRQLTSDQASLTFSTPLPGTTFLLKRTMSMKSGSPDLVMDYEITNLMPPDSASDDPEHFQLPWRGRFMPGIGSGSIPQLNDHLAIPVKFSADRLGQNLFALEKPTFFERRSVRLGKPVAGVFDTVLHKGIALIGGPVTSHVYIWFNTKGSHKGGGKLYTIEFPRSFYGKKHNDAEPNTPLTVLPGKTLNFSVTIRGLSSVKNEADLLQQAGF